MPAVNEIYEDRNTLLAKKSTITPEEVKSAPTLTLEVTESPTLEKGQKFVINAAGYTKSKRKVKDGCTFMGTLGYDETTGECHNDILIPQKENGMGDVHLLIQYNPESKSYSIRDCGKGTGTFIKIEKLLELKRGYIISYGDSHMFVNMLTPEKIQLKFLDGPKADHMLYVLIFIFSLFGKEEGIITIGRMSGCHIKFEDYSLSRKQCIIVWDKDCWMLNDGDGQKPSTNGTW